MSRKFVLAALVLTYSFSASAQVPVTDLAKPPASATHYIIQSTGGKHGDSWLWVGADGTRMGRESMNLRGQVFELDSSGKAGADGMPASVTIRGVTPQGDAGETFTIAGGKASWKSPVDAGSAAYAKPAFYSSQGGPIDMSAWLLERLLASPDHTLALLPGGKAKAEKLTTLTVGEGAAKTGNHGLGDHRHHQLPDSDLGGCQGQVLRLLVLPELAAGAIRVRTRAHDRGADEGDGGAGAGAGEGAGEDARGRRGVHECARVRCGREGVPRRSDGHRRQGAHRRGVSRRRKPRFRRARRSSTARARR